MSDPATHAHSGFRRDPAAANTEAVEDYTKAIYALGDRQKGRPISPSVLVPQPDVDGIKAAVASALDPGFRETIAGQATPFGVVQFARSRFAAISSSTAMVRQSTQMRLGPLRSRPETGRPAARSFRAGEPAQDGA